MSWRSSCSVSVGGSVRRSRLAELRCRLDTRLDLDSESTHITVEPFSVQSAVSSRWRHASWLRGLGQASILING